MPYSGQGPQGPPGFSATPFATGLVNPRRLLVLPNGDVLVGDDTGGTIWRISYTGDARRTGPDSVQQNEE